MAHLELSYLILTTPVKAASIIPVQIVPGMPGSLRVITGKGRKWTWEGGILYCLFFHRNELNDGEANVLIGGIWKVTLVSVSFSSLE